MHSFRCLSFVGFLLLWSARVAHADGMDFPQGPPPAGGSFSGRPPQGQMPPEMKDMMELMRWKRDHQDDVRIQAFDKDHGDLPRPTPGQAPDMDRMKSYASDLKKLKQAVEATPKVAAAANDTPTKQTPAEKQSAPAKNSASAPVSQCQPDKANSIQSQLNDLIAQVTRLTARLDHLPAPGYGQVSFGPGAQTEESKFTMQRRLVAQQVRKTKEQTDSMKEQVDDLKDQDCPMPDPDGDDDFEGPPGGGFGGPPSGGPRGMPGGADFAGMPAGPPGFDIEDLMLDLPESLQNQIDDAKRDQTRAKSRFKTAMRRWKNKCQRQMASRGGMAMGQMQMTGGGMPNFGGMGGNSQPLIGLAAINASLGYTPGAMNMGGMSAMGGYGGMRGGYGGMPMSGFGYSGYGSGYGSSGIRTF
ncbi:hypothetical protein WDW37_00855 [Bdellovibrionota bacterium FG-1]